MAAIQTIVLIDDDTDLGQLVKSNLSAHFDLKYFEEPVKAMPYLRNNLVAAVILDYYLKNTNGLLVAWELIEAFPLTPILLVSSDNSVKDKIAEMRFRHVDFLEKPFQSRDLMTSLVKILRISNSGDIRPDEYRAVDI